MKRSLFGLIALLLLSAGCTGTQRASLTDLGKPTLFVSHSGACVNYIGISEGRIRSISQSDGWELVDQKTGKRVRVGGDAIIIEATEAQMQAYTNAVSLFDAQQALLELVQTDGTIVKVPSICQ